MNDSLSRSFSNRLTIVVALAAALLNGATTLANDNWPAWRGPLSNGVAPATAKPVVSWSETSNVKWKVKIPGLGSASPIVWENRIFIQTAIPVGAPGALPPAPSAPGATPASGEVQFIIQCLDRATGKVLWQQVARQEVPHEGHHADGTFASASPVTDGKNVWAYFGSRGLYCYDMEGKLQWTQDFGDMKIKLGFGESISPVLHGDLIVINWDADNGSFITALNKSTGQAVWKTPRDEMTNWSTPFIVEHQGQPQIVTNATSKIRTYELATGKLLWECAGLTANTIPMPVGGDGVVYCTSGFRGNALLAIRLGGSGDITNSNSILWKHSSATPYVPSPILVNDRIYFFAGNTSALSCFDAKTGKPIFESKRIEGLEGVYASPVFADGRLYLTGRNGTTVVIRQSDTVEVLATNKLNEKIDPSPAIVGQEIFLRGKEYLYCIAEK